MPIFRRAIGATLTLVIIVIALVAGIGIGYFGGTLTENPSTTTPVKTYTVTTTAAQTSGTTWLFEGAYANYSGTVCDYYPSPGAPCGTTDNYTETVSIRVVQFNLTRVEYKLDAIPSSGTNGAAPASKTEWLNVTESLAYLLCKSVNQPVDTNLTIGGRQIPAVGYSCFVGPNDYGTIYLGQSIPFVISFNHSVTVSPYRETWSIVNTNIPGLT